MFYMPIIGFVISVPMIIVGGIALILGGAFAGSQLDDKIEQTTKPIKDELDAIPSIIKWPIIIGATVFLVIIAKKASKKVLK